MNAQPELKERILHGVAASPGVAHGPAYVLYHKELEIPIYNVEPEDQELEIERFEKALLKTRIQIAKVRSEVSEKLGEDEAKIFDAHLLVLEDKALIDETIHEHQQFNYNIEYCFHSVAKRYIEAFGDIDDEYIKERVTDIRDVTKRVLHNLLGHTGTSIAHLSKPKILVSEDLVPSDTAGLDRKTVMAMVTDAGSRTSHAVIMARSLQVPAVVGLHDVTEQVTASDTLLVDGYEGVVIINPTDATLYKYKQLKTQKEALYKVFETSVHLPPETIDGYQLKVAANIEGPKDTEMVKSKKMDGVGLFRTEALFLAADSFPDEETQFEAYKAAVQATAPNPTTIRTIDLGGDKKTTTFLHFNKEANPFMGFRAIRFCLEHKALFLEQLRAILRASAYGPTKIMYPMISSLDELIRVREALEEAKAQLREAEASFDENIESGAMIEIPAAAYTGDLLTQECDFFSIGTNDLIQYMLAVDRGNDRIAHLYEPNHPAVLRTIKTVIESAQKAEIKVSICGEMASDPLYLPVFIGLMADEISIAPSAAAEIKYLIRTIEAAEAKRLTKKVLKLKSAQEVFVMLNDFYQKNLQKALENH